MVSSFQSGGGDVEPESESLPHIQNLYPLLLFCSLFYNMQKTGEFVIFCVFEDEPTNLYFYSTGEKKLLLYYSHCNPTVNTALDLSVCVNVCVHPTLDSHTVCCL